MAQNLLVTVQGGLKREDVELPGDVTVKDLLPLLIDICKLPVRPAVNTRDGSSAWVLYTLDQPLPLNGTLSENGVLDGDILSLQMPGSTRMQQPPQLPASGRLVARPPHPNQEKIPANPGGIQISWSRD